MNKMILGLLLLSSRSRYLRVLITGFLCVAVHFTYGQVTIRELFGGDAQILGLSNEKNANVNHTEGAPFQDEKRGEVFLITHNGERWGYCSGSIINTVEQDGRLFILTANHCINKIAQDDFTIYFSANYEMAHAVTRGIDGQDDNITSVFPLPVTARVRDQNQDIALLEVDPNLDREALLGPGGAFYNTFAFGWSISPNEKPWANISHPKNDHKKFFMNPKTIITSTLLSTTNGSGLYYALFGPWNGRVTSPQRGSSGSPLMNRKGQELAVLSTASDSESDPAFVSTYSALSNSWFRSSLPESGLQHWLDAGNSWISKVPGGYLSDLIPSSAGASAVWNIIPGITHSTPLPDMGSINPLEKVLFINPLTLFDNLKQEPSIERILGIKINNPSEDRVVMTVHALVKKQDQTYKEKFIYGTYADQNSPETFDGFRQKFWGCLNPPEGYPSCDLEGIYATLDLPSTLIYRGALLQAFGQDVKRKPPSLNLLSDYLLPVVIRLWSQKAIEVTAVSYPGDVPKNALEIFDPEVSAELFRTLSFQDSRGFLSKALHVDNISVENLGETRVIPTGDNGGYLNMTNPNYLIENVLVGYPVDNNEVLPNLFMNMDIHNTTGADFYYKVWLDYYQTVQNGNYVFTEASTNNTVSELIAEGSGTDVIDEEYDLPNYRKIGLGPGERKLIRMRVAISNENNVKPDGAYLNGEVEDYLMEIVAPTCETLRPPDYDDYAEAELSYCGKGGYRETKESLSDSYQESIPGSLTFTTNVSKDLPYATATGFQCSFNGRNRKDKLNESCFSTVVHETQSGEYFLKDGQLKMDVYYPETKADVSIADLAALPLIIYVHGGGFVINGDDQLGEKVCEWYASKGYIVAAIDYRLGMNITNGELSKRAIIRAWQDLEAAVQYWRHTPQLDNGTHRWKIDPQKIYGVGFSAGAITILHNLYLDRSTYGDERALDFEGNPSYLTASSGHYSFTTTNWSEIANALKDIWNNDPDAINHINNAITANKTYHTYDLEDYPTYPCIGANSACDPNNAPDRSEFEEFLSGIDGRLNQGVAFSGAIAKTEWMANEAHRQMRFVQHERDAVVSYLEDEPFSYLGDLVNVYNFATSGSVYTPKLSGGGTMLAEGYSNFKGQPLLADNMAGGGIPYHRSLQKFGSTDKNELEPKLMYYTDAFFTKDWTSTIATARLASSEEEVEEEPIKEEPVFNIFPNPASDEVNVIVDIPQSGPLDLQIIDLQGKTVYQMQRDQVREGTQWIRLGDLDLPSGMYVLQLIANGIERSERLIMKR
ncbi:MAG: T9SS type A sorting domain-containing protein [Cyclobacteriaceae bacterium]